MGIVERALRLLFPKGLAWTLPDVLGTFVGALALSFDRLRLFLRGVLDESLPGSADDTLPEWFETLGLAHDSSQPLATRQATAEGQYTATGGQSFSYLQDQMQRELPEVFLNESPLEDTGVSAIVGIARVGVARVGKGNPAFSYFVRGFVDDSTQFARMLAILQRIFPLYLEPVIGVTNRSILGIGRVGVGHVGTARVGNSP